MQKLIGFDSGKYLDQQTQAILERVKQFNNKLYLEFGGKLLFDYHAHRVLPGFDPNVKMRLLQKLKEKAEIILCIYAGDIERKKMRADFGITYDADALKVIDELNQWGLELRAVVITRFDGQPAAKIFKNKLERRKIKVYTHQFTKGYPTDIDRIVSKEGYGANPYIKTKKSLVVVIGPGPGSGKLATCLSQLYHEYKKGIEAGYAKFETFPIWNLPLKHPVNVAYEAATADIKDYNMIDPFHLDKYQQTAVNYNRDIEVFPVLKRILKKITKKADIYKSPTDMGVNRAGFGIVDDKMVKEAACQEIIRRFFRYSCEYALGLTDKDTVERSRLLMEELDIKIEQRRVVKTARQISQKATKGKKESSDFVYTAAMELENSQIITGKSSSLMHAPSSLILNAVKVLAGIPDKIHLLSPNTIESIKRLKKSISTTKTASLDLEETLIALSISASNNPTAALALKNLKKIKNREVHLTHIPSSGDEAGLRKLGVNLTSDPNFSSSSLFFE
jgi:uncharacterized protein (UPF0371 family)